MKLRNKIAAITAAAMLAFTGVGFASWAFTNVESAEIDSITSKVAVGIELTNDSFAVYHDDGDSNLGNDVALTGLYLICDAPTQAELTAAANTDVLAGNGIYWATDAAGANAIANVYIKGSLTKELEDGVLDATSVTVSFTASDNLFSTYINFEDMVVPSATVVSPVTDGAEVVSGNFTLPIATYLIIPSTTAELTTMQGQLVTDLGSAALTFSAQITAKA